MKNPGLDVFSYIRSPNHPLNIDPFEDDPELEENDDNNSDYVPPVNFGRWRNPGQSVHVPVHQGPPYAPGESPEDVIHGEVISPAEQDSADKIIGGDHESDSPSVNPYVEKAREDLHTPESEVAVSTLSRLLRGEHPSGLGPDAMNAAHAWLSQRFTGVRVNPPHGVLEAASPAGSQLVKRHVNLPAVSEQEQPKPSYSLTNKHGTFESHDPKRLVRAMVAFQIVHNEIAQEQGKKKGDDQDNGLASTSNIRDLVGDIADKLRRHRPEPPMVAPRGAVWEPGRGLEKNHKGQSGGYVMPTSRAPRNWLHDSHGTSYSPGHHMRLMLDPDEAVSPRSDPRFPGHTFTYSPNYDSGHTTPRTLGHINYFVRDRVHPAARGAGFDLPPVPKSAPAPKEPKTPKPPKDKDKPSGRMPRTGPTPPAHNPPLSIDPSRPVEHEEDWHRVVPQNLDDLLPPHHGAVKVNDLCPVCASGYLEPYDSDTHECLNCGSLVKHVGFDREASRKPPRGGLGRGLKQIMEYEGDPLNLGNGGSEDPVNDGIEDIPEGGYVHPLAGEENQNPGDTYQAPRDLLGKQAGEADADPLDEHLGKLDFRPIHKPGQERAYVKPDPGIEGAYWRLTEGAPHPVTGERGWVLTADHVPSREQWTQGGKPYRQRSIPLDRSTTGNPDEIKQFRQPLADPGNRVMGDKSFLASGTHPIEDDTLNRAIRDVSKNGRNSKTYWNAFNSTAYEPPSPHPKGTTQRELRGLSSVGNPGLARFVS